MAAAVGVGKINIDYKKCTGCRMCEQICVFSREKKFNPRKARIKVFPFDLGKKKGTHLLNIPNLFGQAISFLVTLLEFLNALGGVTQVGCILESHQLLPDLLAMASEDLLHRIG